MDNLEKRLRAAKPTVPELPREFAAGVMARIAEDGLQPLPANSARPRRWLTVAAALALMGSGLLLGNGFAFELRMNGSLELLYFGSRYLDAFLSALPLDLLLWMLLLTGAGAWLMRRGGGLRMATTWLVLISFGISSGGGAALAQSGLNEQVQRWSMEEQIDWPLLGTFFRHRAHFRNHHPNFKMGRVVALQEGTARLEAPDGTQSEVLLPPGMAVVLGDTLRLAGVPSDSGFTAAEGQICDPQRAGRYFHGMRRMMRGMKKGGMHQGTMEGRPMGPGMMRGMGKGHAPMGGAGMMGPNGTQNQ